jgi:hypothetical protein
MIVFSRKNECANDPTYNTEMIIPAIKGAAPMIKIMYPRCITNDQNYQSARFKDIRILVVDKEGLFTRDIL